MSASAADACVQAHDVMTLAECAELLRMDEGYVREKIRTRARNPIPCYRPGKYVLFSRAKVLAWLESTSTNNTHGKRVRTVKAGAR
jgi:excisionase family DNA binding protein